MCCHETGQHCLTAPSHHLNQCWLVIYASIWGQFYKDILHYKPTRCSNSCSEMTRGQREIYFYTFLVHHEIIVHVGEIEGEHSTAENHKDDIQYRFNWQIEIQNPHWLINFEEKRVFPLMRGELHQPRLWFITGGYLVKRWFLPAATRARGQSNDLNREILASNLFLLSQRSHKRSPSPINIKMHSYSLSTQKRMRISVVEFYL